MAVWSRGVYICVILFVQMNVVTCSQGDTRFVEVYHISDKALAELFRFSMMTSKRTLGLREAIKYNLWYTASTDS